MMRAMQRYWLELSGAIYLALVMGCAIAAGAVPQLSKDVQLFERYPESWGLPAGAPIAIDGAVLRTRVGQRQAFNPSVFSDRSLSNVHLYLTLPAALAIVPSSAWLLQRSDREAATISGFLNRINAGERINNREMLHFAARAAGRFEIGYIVTAQELRRPARGHVTIEVAP